MIHHGDMLAVLPTLDADSLDACATDPPYHLTSIVKRFGAPDAAPAKSNGATGVYARSSAGFMGRKWDGGDVAFRPETWAEVFRVLKPGAHLVAFGGTRTYHRMACAIEDAGFETRDTLAWMYGSGFPKSHDVSKGIDKAAGAEREVVGASPYIGRRCNGREGTYKGREEYRMGSDGELTAPATDAAREWAGWGTALKPAFEPIILARKPLSEPTVAANVLRWGTGALNIAACRVPTATDDPNHRPNAERHIEAERPGFDGGWRQHKRTSPTARWPANLLHDGSDEVLQAFAAFGSSKDGVAGKRTGQNGYDGGWGALEEPWGTFGGSGTAARFFKSAGYTEDDLWSLDLASCVVGCSSLQSEAVVSALANAVARSTPGSGLIRPSYQAPSTSATASELRLISALAIMATQHIVSECSLGSPPERLILHLNHAECVALSKPTGIITITISRWKSSGSAEPVTFSITLPNSARGAKDSELRFNYCAKADTDDRLGSKHPTVKPLALMRWLCRLITPPGGTVLDPFAGTGTTLQAALIEGFRPLGIEREAEYVADARHRLGHMRGDDMPLFSEPAA